MFSFLVKEFAHLNRAFYFEPFKPIFKSGFYFVSFEIKLQQLQVSGVQEQVKLSAQQFEIKCVYTLKHAPFL